MPKFAFMALLVCGAAAAGQEPVAGGPPTPCTATVSQVFTGLTIDWHLPDADADLVRAFGAYVTRRYHVVRITLQRHGAGNAMLVQPAALTALVELVRETRRGSNTPRTPLSPSDWDRIRANGGTTVVRDRPCSSHGKQTLLQAHPVPYRQAIADIAGTGKRSGVEQLLPDSVTVGDLPVTGYLLFLRRSALTHACGGSVSVNRVVSLQTEPGINPPAVLSIVPTAKPGPVDGSRPLPPAIQIRP
ncbi:MAG: hypothetical protein NT029_10115 [Armatimonadetes bacterium]|nr:hypothetical protein [Armatimonadota bacterium]